MADSTNNSKSQFALGRHLTIEYYDCNSDILVDSTRLEDAFKTAAEISGATVLNSFFQSFSPQGISGFLIIAESHFSVHTWPEHDYAAVDIFTCGESILFKKAIDSLKNSLDADEVIISSDMNRGVISNNGFEKMIPVYEDRQHTYTLSWREKYQKSNAWGLLTSVDIYECNPKIIRDAERIKQFVYRLCDKIEMERYGECNVVHFGKDEKVSGFSMTQLIETSLISGHFANATNNTYLDIFSCKFYEPREVAELAISYLEGTHYKMQVALRR